MMFLHINTLIPPTNHRNTDPQAELRPHIESIKVSDTIIHIYLYKEP